MPRKRQALIVEDNADADVTSELELLLARLGFEVTRIQELHRVEEAIGNHLAGGQECFPDDDRHHDHAACS